MLNHLKQDFQNNCFRAFTTMLKVDLLPESLYYRVIIEIRKTLLRISKRFVLWCRWQARLCWSFSIARGSYYLSYPYTPWIKFDFEAILT